MRHFISAVMAAATTGALHSSPALAQSRIEACVGRILSGLTDQVRTLDSVGAARAICRQLLQDDLSLAEAATTNELYKNQIADGHVLLYMIVFITLSGIVLAALQLWASYKLAQKGSNNLTEGGEFSFREGNIAIKSSAIGVIILAISLVFFTIFVREVYNISEVFSDAPAGATHGAVPQGPPAK